MQALATGKDTLLRGEYRLLEAIGGGESRVYLARREASALGPNGSGSSSNGSSASGSNASSTWVVARLWKPSSELLREQGAQQLFERAADQMRQAALLRHPVLAMVETSGALDDGTLFIVSEHIEGQPLDVFINSAGIPPLPSVIDLAYRICSGLNTAHRNGLAHAALHPGTVIVRPNADGGAIARLQAKLIDFGTPTCMFRSPPALNAARFMAPEQLELALKPAIQRSEPTVRMNVYGCGALLYAMCTGGPPLPGHSVQELLVAHAAHKIVPPSRINPQVLPALDAIILKALDPEPRARFANAAELANALISIRFERSASGVRPRAAEPAVDLRAPIVRSDATPRDQRVTLDPNDEAAMREAGLEERPTSRTSKLPKQEDDFVAFPSERPTAEIHVSLPSIPPLPRLSPPPPSLPPPLPQAAVAQDDAIPSLIEDELEDVTARAPLPEVPAVERNEKPEPPAPPAVLARPARRSLAPERDWLGRIPPIAFIALAALISISVILSVISQPSDEPTIEVTPLPAPPITPRAQEPAQVPEAENAGASAQREAQVAEAKPAEDPAPRPRSRRAPAPKPEATVPPEPDEPIAKEPSAAHEATPEPADKPEASRPPEEAIAPSPPASPTPAHDESASQTAPKRSPIAPLPDKPAAPIAPLPEKALPRVYDVAIKGSLATSHVRRGIERLQPGIQACYRAVLSARPSGLGEASVEVLIDERGRARGARVGGSVPGSLKSCLEGTARKLSVPPPDTGTVTATWKVSL